MLQSYLKTALRNLLRQRLHTAISIAGLATGMASSLLIFAFVWHESTYESFNEKSGRVFLVGPPEVGNLPTPMIEVMRALPEVAGVAHLWITVHPMLSSHRLQAFQQVTAAGTHLFEFLDIPFVHGDRATALSRPFTTVISERMSHLYFGDEDPIGRTLRSRLQLWL